MLYKEVSYFDVSAPFACRSALVGEENGGLVVLVNDGGANLEPS